jgi:hypothetical protein
MPNGDLLSEFSQPDISRFKKDFMQMMKVGAEIDRYWGEGQKDLDSILKKYEKLIEKFNKKYAGLKIKIHKTVTECNTCVFVKSRNVKEFFGESASRIPGIKAIGRTGFNQAEAGNMEKFAAFLDSVSDKLFITYASAENGSGSVSAILDRKEKMIEIGIELQDAVNENSAAFKICAFYALKSKISRKIDIYGDSATFGFFNLLNEIEKREGYDKFNPRFLE